MGKKWVQLSGRTKQHENKMDSAADGEQWKDKEQWEKETEIKRECERESGDKERLQQQWRNKVCPGGGREEGYDNVCKNKKYIQ